MDARFLKTRAWAMHSGSAMGAQSIRDSFAFILALSIFFQGANYCTPGLILGA
jgi:hypothetical protein